MKKIIPIFLALLTFTSCVCISCGGNTGTSNDSNSNSDLILPGKDRIWWDASFANIDEVKEFIIDLKNAQRNSDFNFGVCEFESPSGYKLFSITFSGHIDNNASKEKDIYNSSYDYFEVKASFYKDSEILPNYNRFDIYFYPFYSNNINLINNEIEYSILNYYDGACEISFSYDTSVVMEVKISAESNIEIDKEKMINELINNYKLVV